MRRNLDLTSDLIIAQAVVKGLAFELGRNVAHDMLYAAVAGRWTSHSP